MAHASAQLEDLLGDTLLTSNASSSTLGTFYKRAGDSSYQNNTYQLTDNTSSTYTIYTWYDVLSILSNQNANSAYFLQLALAKNDAGGSCTGTGGNAADPLEGRWDTFVEIETPGTGGYARVNLYDATNVNGGNGGLVFAGGTSDVAGEDEATCDSNGNTWTLNTGGEWKNIVDVSFPQSSAAWGSSADIDYAVIILSNEATNSATTDHIPLIALPLTSAIQVTGSNTTVTFSTGDLKYTLA